MVRVNSGGPNKDTGISFHRPIITVNGDVFFAMCALNISEQFFHGIIFPELNMSESPARF